MPAGLTMNFVLSVLMLAGFALVGGGVFLLTKKRQAKQGILMLIAAVVMFANVAVWVWPT
ncbi:LPXTG cell wall anchor domain-containing protein [Sphingobium subterraneum]|uniref:LPXTG-motif cell wall-anchored protein n=1 Tax=Sphingobium subterraneum TaxID=627688 RepID=A0A841J880_9SPHN|nr:LPXTG-motif cell wall-anchored protein [Sphingobium subterraneum]